jgi:hypothetical protein
MRDFLKMKSVAKWGLRVTVQSMCFFNSLIIFYLVNHSRQRNNPLLSHSASGINNNADNDCHLLLENLNPPFFDDASAGWRRLASECSLKLFVVVILCLLSLSRYVPIVNLENVESYYVFISVCIKHPLNLTHFNLWIKLNKVFLFYNY